MDDEEAQTPGLKDSNPRTPMYAPQSTPVRWELSLG
jgi:hypothetical protein